MDDLTLAFTRMVVAMSRIDIKKVGKELKAETERLEKAALRNEESIKGLADARTEHEKSRAENLAAADKTAGAYAQFEREKKSFNESSEEKRAELREREVTVKKAEEALAQSSVVAEAMMKEAAREARLASSALKEAAALKTEVDRKSKAISEALA